MRFCECCLKPFPNIFLVTKVCCLLMLEVILHYSGPFCEKRSTTEVWASIFSAKTCQTLGIVFLPDDKITEIPRTLRETAYGHLPRPAEEISEFKLIKLRLWIDLGVIMWICGRRPQIHIISPKSIHNLNLINLNSLICSSKHKCNTSKTNHRHVRKELVTSKPG